MEDKILKAIEIIKEAKEKHGSGLYLAYSGGKDSKVLLDLVKKSGINVPIIHNEHEGETIDIDYALVVKKPKKENVKVFLSTVKLTCQLDATRQDEDKTVIFDGVEIHRSKMPDYKTDNGVFGLSIFYPIKDFNDDDIVLYTKKYL